MRVPFLRWSYFAWVPIPVLLWLLLGHVGPPHVIFEYRYTAPPGRHYDPGAFHLRRYHSCTYWGVDGRFRTVPAKSERCPVIRFLKLQDQ